MLYKVAERFKSIQGEGVYAGTPMAFIRFVGCSVGKRICQHCDTDFDKTYPWRGGGEFTERDLLLWAYPYRHVCLTGGEPLDQDLEPLIKDNEHVDLFHIETSGTKEIPDWMEEYLLSVTNPSFMQRIWICVSPKPGFIEDVVDAADEVKVIVPGLGEMTDALRKQLWESGPPGSYNNVLRWPGLEDALRWEAAGKIVFLQPRNAKFDVDKQNLLYVQDLIRDNPQLRLSVQLHKILKVQ